MVQIPPEKIAEIRDRCGIEQVVGASVRLARRGQRLIGLCPFHSEKSPSFTVSPSKGLYHCFGCKAGGDVFNFVMRLEGIEFFEAVQRLAARAGIELPREEESPAQREARSKKERLLELNDEARAYYRSMLDRAPEAMRYLTEERGLTKVSIAEFGIGWAPPGWTNLADRLAGPKAELAIELGLLGRKDGRIYDRMRGRIVFPIEVPGGAIAGFGARRADWVDPEGPKYLNSPESPIYDKSSILFGLALARDEIRKSRRSIIVEGYLDVIALVQAGFRETIASCGTALTPKHATILRRLAPELVLCYDGDPAGREATRKVAELALSEGLGVRVVDLPEGDDPDTFVRQRGAEFLKKLVDEAPSAIDFFLGRARASNAGGGIAGTTKTMEAVKPLLLAIRDALQRDVAIAACAQQLGVDVQMLRRHLASKEPPPKPMPPPPATRKITFPIVEVEVLKMLLDDPKAVVAELDQREARRAFTPILQAAIDMGVAAYEAQQSFDGPRALEVMREAGGLDERELDTLRALLVESLPENHDLSACVTRLLRAKRDRDIRDIRVRIERETDPEAAARLAAEASRLMTSRV